MDADTRTTPRPAPIWGALATTATLVLMVVAGLSRPLIAANGAIADPGWPRIYTTPAGARVQIYQPQIASWDGQRRLVAYVAVSHRTRGADKAVLGTMRVEADTTVSLVDRLVRFETLRIAEANFGSLDRHQAREVVRDVETAMRSFERVIALDRVLSGLDQSRIRAKHVDGVTADPPPIFFSTIPAILVNFDGDPIWSPIQGSDLRFAINTNWDVFEHTPTKTIYLRNGRVWLKATTIAGPWMPAGALPASFAQLPADPNWKDVKAAIPNRMILSGDMPIVYVSTSPAELILLNGNPVYSAVAGTRLLWVRNTESDVFKLGENGPVYYLVAGRWFSGPGFAGPWTFATPSLPADFKGIGPDHPRARVLASVPGTPQAAEAVVLAQIPQTAKVDVTNVSAPVVAYQGEPQFQPIEQTTLRRAVNTDKDVIQVGSSYYLCFQGVWFVASRPGGPWIVAMTVPAQIYLIPPSSPVHHVTYVTIVEADVRTVTFAAAAGYSGVTIAWGCAVWGTGWYYPPYVWYGGYYPVYYPFYPTYGYSAWYNAATATYARGAVAYGPYGGVGATARYNAATGTYSRGAAAWGPYGASGVAEAYNPRTGAYGRTAQQSGVYGNWGSSYVQRGDDWARTSHATNNLTGVTSGIARTDEGAAIGRSGPNGNGFVAAGEDGVYAGRDGNVYRRAEGGGWQKYEDGGWGATQHPGETAAGNARDRAAAAGEDAPFGQLERDHAARQEGSQRVREGRPRGDGSGARAARPSGGRSGGRGGRR